MRRQGPGRSSSDELGLRVRQSCTLETCAARRNFPVQLSLAKASNDEPQHRRLSVGRDRHVWRAYDAFVCDCVCSVVVCTRAPRVTAEDNSTSGVACGWCVKELHMKTPEIVMRECFLACSPQNLLA